MDFNDTPEEAAFRDQCRAWLAENAAEYKDPPRQKMTEAEALQVAKKWQAKKAAGGYAAITWPTEWGGMGGTPIQSVIYAEEEGKYHIPGGFFAIGLGMCIPTMMAWAKPEQNKRYVPKALAGEEIWCQLFSEPAAGSDLAGIRTKAVRDGDDWVINGQKIWTSGAHYSDFGVLVTRSDPNVAKHKGLTYFFLDMKSPGVEVRPIKQISGGANFNEVYFTDVRIPDSQRLGEPGQGWEVSLTTLMNERLSINESQNRGATVNDLINLARMVETEDGPAIKNAAVRERIADWHAKVMGLRYGRYRTLTALSKGQRPGPESSINKGVFAPLMQDLAHFGLELMDQGGVLRGKDADDLAAAFMEAALGSPGLRIAGGTDEVMKNIIAERVLGLPQDVRVDKDVAFKDLPSGSAN